jgi:zinc transporter
MSGFGYRIADGRAERVALDAALTCGGAFVWAHLSDTAEHAQAWLRDEARLDDYVVDALTAAETRPRCEQFGGGALLNLRGRADEELESGDLLASVRIWAVKGRVFSVTRKHMVATDAVEAQVKAQEVADPGDLIAAFAGAITGDLDPVVAELGDSLDDCEEQLATERAFELRRTVARVRVAAIGYRRFLQPQRAALEKLAALPGDWLQDDDRLHLAAAADRAARMAEELESIRERAALVHETLTDLRAEQLDHRGLVIAIVAMIFLPLTFLTGVYGMNIDGLPLAHDPHAFELFVLLCLLITVPVLGWFVRKHWF